MRISDWSSDVCSSDLGDTFWYKQRTGRTVTAIYPLHPSSMSLEDGKWNFDNGSLRMNDIDPLDLVIFKHFHPDSLTRGLSPLEPLRSTLENEWSEIGRAHDRTPVTNTHLVCSLLIEKNKNN